MTADNEHVLLAAFDEHWKEYRKQFKQARQDTTEETIHDLRVAARRMQALLGIVRTLEARPPVRKMRRVLSKQLDELDGLRDTQVLVQQTEQSVNELPQLLILRQYLQDRSDELARDARNDLRKVKPSDIQQRIRRIRKVVKRHSDEDEFVEQVLQAVDTAYVRTLARFGKLDAGEPNTIHRVRIAFKKLRYMIEMVDPFLPKHPGNFLDRMHDYQDAMGQVHDTTVFLETLKDYEVELQRRHSDHPSDLDPKPVERYFRTRLADLVRAYFERKDELYTFWRSAPDQPFPWEKSHELVHRKARTRRGTGSQQQRGAGQPAASHQRRAKKVPADRAGAGQPGNSDRSNPDQPVPAGS